jgi:phosphoserine phosphatase RsbU/P
LEYPDGRVGLVIADVAGKGLVAALMTTALQARVLLLAEEMQTASQLVARLNTSTGKKAPSHRFITLFFGLINADRSELVYCNAGHTPSLLARADGTVERLAAGGLPLGLFPTVQYEEVAVKVSRGDVLLLYTDGVTEAMNDRGDEFGEERLAGALREHRGESVTRIIDGVERALSEWCGDVRLADDIAMVVAKITA